MSRLPIPSDWDEPTDGYAYMLVCVPNSVQWRAIARGTIYNLTRGRNWDEETGIIIDTQATAWAIYESVCMANCDELNGHLDRIATALESIDVKTSEIISWDDLLTDLGNALGLGHGVYKLMQSIRDMFPTIAPRIDATPILSSIIEYFTWRAPLKAMFGTIITIHSGMLAAMATGKTLDTVKTILLGLQYITQVADGWRQAIFGTWSISDFVFDVWDWFIADADGGTGGVDPDADPDRHIDVQFYNDGVVSKLEEIRVMLETRLIAETAAGNTRSDDLEAILNAVENVLGGTYEPQ